MKEAANNKLFGYWLSAAVLVLCAVWTAMYGAGYMGSAEFSWAAFIIAAVNVAAGVVLLAVRRFDWFPVASFVLMLVVFVLFALGMVNYVANVVVGIDSDGVGMMFVAMAVLSAVILACNWAALCMKQKGR